jgi:hypothetical protein
MPPPRIRCSLSAAGNRLEVCARRGNPALGFMKSFQADRLGVGPACVPAASRARGVSSGSEMASALTARSCSAGRQRSLTFAALIRVARVRMRYSNGLRSRGHGTSCLAARKRSRDGHRSLTRQSRNQRGNCFTAETLRSTTRNRPGGLFHCADKNVGVGASKAHSMKVSRDTQSGVRVVFGTTEGP